MLSACAVQKKSTVNGGLATGDANLFASSEDAAILQSILLSDLAATEIPTDIKHATFEKQENYLLIIQDFSRVDTIPATDSAEVKLKVHPFAIAGLGLTAAAVAAGVLAFTGPMIPIWISLLLLGGGLTFVTLGIKKIKQYPEKYKGEKLATSVYWAMIPIGLFLMLLPIYLLFEF